ncbi:hypothetical protein [Pedobacter psychroterrae]|uniref:Uncharacterized protein n=1 Tax=Pedobacter psychroterrae TaxID=2530453 RepID=A0A4R0NHJ6_9SPHI|nr:hypothetical protein [Pedobacter psychroterrae]TCD00052.1 hypothetical protein EZ437_15140 [Pedobacter psychroterrae]
MTFNDYIIDKLTFYKVVFSIFYALCVINAGDKLAFPMLITFIFYFPDSNATGFSIAGLSSLFYLFYTGFYHSDKVWNYKWTIVSASALISMLSMPIYCAYIQRSPFSFTTIGIALLMGTLIIYGSALKLKLVRSEMASTDEIAYEPDE